MTSTSPWRIGTLAVISPSLIRSSNRTLNCCCFPSTLRIIRALLPAAKSVKSKELGRLDPAISFIVSEFLPLDDAALNEACRVWSVPRDEADAFTREEAQRVWALRIQLPLEAQSTFDRHTVPARRQLAELYFEVLLAGTEQANRG